MSPAINPVPATASPPECPSALPRANVHGLTALVELDGLRLMLEPAAAAWRIEQTGSGAVVGAIRLPRLTDARGRVHLLRVQEVRLDAQADERVTVVVAGAYAAGLTLMTRWRFDPVGLVRGDVTLRNPRAARHPGGLWDLGDAGSVLLRDFSLAVVLNERAVRLAYQLDAQSPSEVTQDTQLELYQDSSGGEHWDSQNHVGADGRVTTRFRGYRGRAGQRALAGLRAEPAVALATATLQVAAMIPEFWQQFPKAVEADARSITLRLFPRQTAEPIELQGGEQKTHTVYLAFSAPAKGSDGLAAVRRAAKDVGLKAAISRLPGLPAWHGGDAGVLARLDELLARFIDGPRGLLARREEVDEYGWRHYGELHADHEELHYRGPLPLISHYKNQFDPLCGFLLQYLRTGEDRWLQLARPLARHVIDIDIYHTVEDRPAYNGGLFWFTDHYLHARTSTHRTFSRHNRPAGQPYGGGPGAEHNFTTGLLLYHRLTGDEQAREAVISLAEWVLAMDDERRNVLGLFDDGPTGLASLTGDRRYHGPGRGSGNSINALLDAWLLTQDGKYMAYAQTLIRRCIHPQSDLAALHLLHAEKRWSYPMFLISVAKYLECKVDAGQIDADYGYAQASLVHVGRWMLAHERPYFDRKEELEYPTEAWPAQELRKANALRLAAAHVDEPLRGWMLRRGNELAERAWTDLSTCERPTTTRTMAVLMTEGLRDAQLRSGQLPAMPRYQEAWNLAPPEPFVPQWERIKQRLRSPGGIAALVLAAANPRRWPRLLNPR